MVEYAVLGSNGRCMAKGTCSSQGPNLVCPWRVVDTHFCRWGRFGLRGCVIGLVASVCLWLARTITKQQYHLHGCRREWPLDHEE